jgi:hypothetical protein
MIFLACGVDVNRQSFEELEAERPWPDHRSSRRYAAAEAGGQTAGDAARAGTT